MTKTRTTKFFKTTYKVTVLSEGPLSAHMDLEDVLAEMNDGDLIGEVSHEGTDAIQTKKELREELEAIGNDGTFFDC
jgi:hypothetical protein